VVVAGTGSPPAACTVGSSSFSSLLAAEAAAAVDVSVSDCTAGLDPKPPNLVAGMPPSSLFMPSDEVLKPPVPLADEKEDAPNDFAGRLKDAEVFCTARRMKGKINIFSHLGLTCIKDCKFDAPPGLVSPWSSADVAVESLKLNDMFYEVRERE
jgi:hypothetical protein